MLEKAAAPAEWNLSLDQFREAVDRSVAHRFGALPGSSPDRAAIEKYIESLHHADLSLACACGAGNSAAWDFFVERYRPELYRAARAIAGDSGARELADSLYAELYGLRESGGRRKSLFEYFHGRSKLGTWLRAILAQRHVDEIRPGRRTESLDGDDDRESIASESVARAGQIPVPDAEREKFLAMLQTVLVAELATLEARARLRLAYYYVDGLTLAEIGKLLGEHEATASRSLERTRRQLRADVENVLREHRKLSEAQIQLCFEYAREQWPFDLTGALSRGTQRPEPARFPIVGVPREGGE